MFAYFLILEFYDLSSDQQSYLRVKMDFTTAGRVDGQKDVRDKERQQVNKLEFN